MYTTLTRDVIEKVEELNQLLREHDLQPITGISFEKETWMAIASGVPMVTNRSLDMWQSIVGIPVRIEARQS